MNYKVNGLYVIIAITGIFLGLIPDAKGQYRVQHQVPTGVEGQTTTTLTFEVPGINPSEVQDAFIFYKVDGGISFQQEIARLSQSVFEADITINDDNAAILEYYFEIQFNNGATLTYPSNLGEQGPIRVDIIEEKNDQLSPGAELGIDYTILSPEPGEQVLPTDAVVAIALFYEQADIDTATSSLELYLDNENITEKSAASDFFLTYVPQELSFGNHHVSLKLKSDGKEQEVVSWNFGVTSRSELAGSAGLESPDRLADNFVPSGQAELLARNQVIAGNTNDVLSGNFRISGRKDKVRYTAYGLLTSQADPRIQPQNRYGAELYVGNWFELQAGHIYPSLSPLTITGQRIQGINTAFRPFNGAVNIQFLLGKMRRSVSNIYGTIQPQIQDFNNIPVDTTYLLGFESGGIGTYDRNVMGGRLSFGKTSKFKFGLNALRVQDDTTSIDVIRNYNDVLTMRPEAASSLSPQDQNKLQAQPNLLAVNGNPKPKGNFIAGTDFMVSFDDSRVQLRTDAAFSLLNEDISGGTLNAKTADDLGFTLDDFTEDVLNRLSWLIIINENLNALPLRFNENGSQSKPEFFFPTSIIGTESELALNYFKNNFQLAYRWVGPDFNSLANATTRKDIAGITATDRFRLFNNQLYVTLGYENIDDNVANTPDATTTTITYRGNVSWYPISRDLPRISMGLMNRSRDNSVALFNPFVASGLQNRAIQNYESINGTPQITVNPRMANTTQFTTSISQQFGLLGITHDASINYSLLTTNDNVFAFGDATSNSFSFNINNRFNTLPLNTNVGFSINNTQTGTVLTDINIVGINLGGSMYFLEDKLNVNANIAFTSNRAQTVPLDVDENGTPNDSADDIYIPSTTNVPESKTNSYIFSVGSRYDVTENHAFLATMRFTNVQSSTLGLQTPNDRLLQIRYIFSF